MKQNRLPLLFVCGLLLSLLIACGAPSAGSDLASSEPSASLSADSTSSSSLSEEPTPAPAPAEEPTLAPAPTEEPTPAPAPTEEPTPAPTQPQEPQKPIVSEPLPGPEWPYVEINGHIHSLPHSYLAKPGTYTVKLFKDGQQVPWFQRFETDDSSICTAKDNGDGSFTLTVKKAGECSIRMYYAFEKNAPSLTATDLGVTAYTDKFSNEPGITLWWHNYTIKSGFGFGASGYPLYVAEVLLDGVRQSEYTVTSDSKNCTCSVQADGTLLIETSSNGKVWFTVKCDGKSARFSASFTMIPTSAPAPTPAPEPEPATPPETPAPPSSDGIGLTLGRITVNRGNRFGIGRGSHTVTAYFNGSVISDYTVSVADTSVCTAQKNADGTFELAYLKPGKTSITIHYQGEAATFDMQCVS